MSRLIKLTEEHDGLLQEMITKMRNTKMIGGEFKFTAKLPEIDRKATVLFSTIAYAKMLSLIMTFDKEVGWYGTAHREGELDDDLYIIDDILVFPQEVTGVTVDSDDEKRLEWFNTLPIEELKNIRCDCHSHVNMSTNPSGTDDKEVEAVLENLSGDAFRIFMIWNKKLEFTVRIFDMAKNIFFGTKDVIVDTEEFSVGAFLNDATSKVKNKTTYTKTYSKNAASTTTSKKKTEEEEMREAFDELYDDDDWDDDDYYYRRKGKKRSGYYGYGYY